MSQPFSTSIDTARWALAHRRWFGYQELISRQGMTPAQAKWVMGQLRKMLPAWSGTAGWQQRYITNPQGKPRVELRITALPHPPTTETLTQRVERLVSAQPALTSHELMALTGCSISTVSIARRNVRLREVERDLPVPRKGRPRQQGSTATSVCQQDRACFAAQARFNALWPARKGVA